MARRRVVERTPSVLGETRKSTAIARIRTWAAKKAQLSIHYRPSVEDMVRINFRDEEADRLRAALGLTATMTNTGTYEGPLRHTNFTMNFSDYMVTPGADRLHIQRDRGEEYLEAWEQLYKIHIEFCVVEHVLSWLDRHGTAGAMRYYFPSVSALAPDAPALSGELGQRHSVPHGVGDQIRLIRQASVTVANALLMPDAPTPPRTPTIRFSIGSHSEHVEGLDASIYIASQTYNFGSA